MEDTNEELILPSVVLYVTLYWTLLF